MDYLKQLYEQAMIMRYRQYRETFCYQQCLKTQGVISQSIMYCQDGCFLYKDNEQNYADKICEQYKYVENFFDSQMKHLKFNPDLVFEKCKLGVTNMDKVFKEWKDDEIKNGPRNFVRDMKEFVQDPEKVTNQRNVYYVDRRFKNKSSKGQQK